MWKTLSEFLLFRVAGFRIVGEIPADLKKYLVIAAPHTSWLDFPLGLLIRSIIQRDIRFIGKESLFKGPFGLLFHALGGYPVNREQRSNMVDTMVEIFSLHDQFAIAISPEGTRKRVDKFKTGFYHIAKGAGIPIVMVQFDFEHRKVVIAEPFYPTADKDRDLAFIWQYFKGVKGKVPDYSIL